MRRYFFDISLIALSVFVVTNYGWLWYGAYWLMVIVVVLLWAVALGIYDGIKDALDETRNQ